MALCQCILSRREKKDLEILDSMHMINMVLMILTLFQTL